MEHLPLPRDVATPGPSLVPYVCKQEYDRGPFLTYSARLGLSDSVAHEIQLDYNYVGRLPQIPLAELESLVQTWLFFGLLTEVLGTLFEPSQYVTSTFPANAQGSHDKVLNTSQLVPTVNLWMQQVHEAANMKDESRSQYEHIAKCLHFVANMLTAVRPALRPDFNPLIRSSIASVGELLSHATNQVYAIENFIEDNRCPGTWSLLYDNPGHTRQMLRGGYCPYEIHRIRNLSLTVQSYHFLVWMDRTGPSAQHQSCTDMECRANQINLSRYTTKHQRDGCQCTDFFVDVKDVIRILSRGLLPLLRMTLASHLGDVRIDVVEATTTSKYVAISHIWADGLGNPFSNALPGCQLQHLYQIVRSLLEKQTDDDPGEVVFLWIDTLCCPVEPPEAKIMALNQIRKPYIDASHVLVLDSSLQRVDLLGLAPEELCMRIFTSGWMRRMWTLQEGALPRRLWFQFRYLAVELDSIFNEVFDKIYNIDISRRALLLDIVALYGGLRHFFHAKENMPSTDIVTVDDALQFRSVSVPTDEAIQIGGLLNLDLGYILDGPAESRMQRVWPLVSSAPGGIPKTILFNRGPRLRQTGYRWAPESLLSSRGFNESTLRSYEAYNTGRLTSTGLNVHVSAFSTAIMGSAPGGVPKNPWGVFNDRNENSILCRHDGGIWFCMAVKYSQADKEEVDRDASSRPASLHTFLKDGSQTRRLLLESAFKFEATCEGSAALLVHDAAEPHSIGPTQVVSDMIVGIEKQEDISQILLEAAYQASQSLLDDEITAQYADLAVEDEEEQRRNHAYADLEVQLGTRITALAESIVIGNILGVISAQEVQHLKCLARALITSFYLGGYCVLGPILSSGTEWCVD